MLKPDSAFQTVAGSDAGDNRSKGMSDDFSDRPGDPADGAGKDSRAASWIISGMPEDVVIEAEREALRRGLKLGAWLEEVIQHALLSESTDKDQAPDTATRDDGFSPAGN